MGGGRWSTDFYEEQAKHRAATNTPVFKHDVDVRAGRAVALHPNLDPSKFGGPAGAVRESRDSAEHPNSVPIIFALDVTGSMAHIPAIVQSKLDKMMTTTLEKGILEDPQFCFVAIGDSHTDKVPLQVGQFESGNLMEDDIGRIFLERGGGGSGEEGYEMAFYFAARKTATDAWDKRKRKGYLFLTGDELAYDTVDPRCLHRIFGGEASAKAEGLSTAVIVKEAQERFHCYFIIPEGADHAGDTELFDYWEKLLGKGHVLRLKDAAQVCDLVALTIGLNEGTASAAAVEGLSPVVKEAISPVLAATQATVAAAKKSGAKTARL